jgi:pyruvate dehydrogenase phosphatase
LQVSRSVGDFYLKKAEFNREPLYAKFRLRQPFKMPILSSDPSISVHELQPHDQFLIFASDGLWEHLSNQEAVDIVQNHPRNVRYLSQQWQFLISYCIYLHEFLEELPAAGLT